MHNLQWINVAIGYRKDITLQRSHDYLCTFNLFTLVIFLSKFI